MSCELRALLLCTLSLSLLGCGGGGDDDDEEEAPEDESAVGIWNGTYQPTGFPFRSFNLLAAPNGQFVGTIGPTNSTSNDGRLIVGTGDVVIANLVASGSVFPLPGVLINGAASASIGAFSGHVTERVSLTGSFTAGGETGAYNLNFNAKTDRPSSLATVQGVYANANSTATMTITSTGQMTFNTTTGCVGNGTIAVTDAAVNIYSWSLTITGCASLGSPSGLATLDDFNGMQSNLLVLMGSQPERMFYYSGSK